MLLHVQSASCAKEVLKRFLTVCHSNNCKIVFFFRYRTGQKYFWIWRSWDRASLMYFLSITNKMQRYTIFFITVNALRVSGGFSAHHVRIYIGFKTFFHVVRHIDSIVSYLPTLVAAASKLDLYPMLCVQFLSSWWWAEKPPETCRTLTVIKNIV